jgi:hypothetical protein
MLAVYFYSFARLCDAYFCLSLECLDWKLLHPDLPSFTLVLIYCLPAWLHFTSIIITYMPCYMMWWLVGCWGGGSGLAMGPSREVDGGLVWREHWIPCGWWCWGALEIFLALTVSLEISTRVRGFTLEGCTWGAWSAPNLVFMVWCGRHEVVATRER